MTGVRRITRTSTSSVAVAKKKHSHTGCHTIALGSKENARSSFLLSFGVDRILDAVQEQSRTKPLRGTPTTALTRALVRVSLNERHDAATKAHPGTVAQFTNQPSRITSH